MLVPARSGEPFGLGKKLLESLSKTLNSALGRFGPRRAGAHRRLLGCILNTAQNPIPSRGSLTPQHLSPHPARLVLGTARQNIVDRQGRRGERGKPTKPPPTTVRLRGYSSSATEAKLRRSGTQSAGRVKRGASRPLQAQNEAWFSNAPPQAGS